jgi:hypothetical protein
MLSKAEYQYLQGQKQVSQSYERKLKCLLRKELEVLQRELPLLSKLFADNFKNFSCELMSANEGPSPQKKQEENKNIAQYSSKNVPLLNSVMRLWVIMD